MADRAQMKSVLAALVFLTAVITGFSAEPPRKSLPGHVVPATKRLMPLARLAATNELSLAIGLPLRNTNELGEFLRQLSDPASPKFRKFLSPAEFTARFGPTESDYETVKNFVRTNGFTITGTHGNRLVLDVAGKSGAAERAFHVTLKTFRHPREPRDFFAPDTEPSVDTALPIADVSGLENYTRAYPKIRRTLPGAKPNYGSAPNGVSYFGNDFRAAYAPGTTLDGTGQSVGLFQLEGYYASDIAKYAAQTGGGRTNILLQNVLIDGFSGTPTASDTNGIAECSLDIEMAMAMAPGLSQIVVFEGSQANFIPNDVLNLMAASNTVKNLSSSWGWSGGPTTTTDNIFKTMAAQGQSFFNASGDSDAFPSGYVDNSGNTTVPSSSPYITQVGGTTLATPSAGGAYSSETVWNWGGGSGSSGGVSTYYSIPAWQQGISSFLNNGGSMTTRNIPDVALTADNVYVYYHNTSGNFGGTSCAAPLWAGFMALVNQQAAASGQSSIGFINPAIYEVANESLYNSAFHDIATGNNTSPTSPNAFYAVQNYDLCTGVGSPNGTNLVNALVNPDPLVVVSSGGFIAVGAPGGGFNISTTTFVVTNAGNSALQWSLINTAAWLNASSSGGTLAAGAGVSVDVGLNNVASNQPGGIYPASILFSNVTTGVSHLRFFALEPADALLILPTNNFTFVGQAGGPFAPAAQSIILTNARASALNWSLNNTSAWFGVSPSAGTLAPGAQTNVAFTLTAPVTNLANGTYPASFQVTNLSSQFVQSITGQIVIGQSLVQNGGFETGDVTGWSFNGTAGFNGVVGNSAISGMTPHSGSYFFAFGENGALAYVSQSLPTLAGQKYLLSVWCESPNTSPSTPNEFAVAWNGTTIYDKSNMGKVGWTNLQFVVSATAANTLLKISGRDDPYWLGLDDVSVIAGFAPAITSQPTSLTQLAGGNVFFAAFASGSTNLAFQWRKNGTNISNGTGISGTTSNVLSLAGVTTNSSANYTLVVTNLFGSVTSSVASLLVVVPATITASSVTNRTVECGNNTNNFTLTAVGTAPLSIQWSFNGTPLTGATNASFSITNLSVSTNTVSVTVTNLYGSATSNATLAVRDTLAPVVMLIGAGRLTNELGSAFTDSGATANDICAGGITVAVSGTVITNATGTNTLTYTASDISGNTATTNRTVIVRDTTPPIISWSFTNLIVTANSNCIALMPDVTGTNDIEATDLSGSVTITQSPTNNAVLQLGTNIVVLTVADASGNQSYSTNHAIVIDQTPPVFVSEPSS